MATGIRRVLAAAFFAAAPALAQIATDGSLGPRTTLTGNSIFIPSSLGTVVGRNAFHSFRTFNVGTGQVVSFGGFGGPTNAPLENIVGRVTGGAASTILGTIRSAIPGTALYLINPYGIVFGEGAVVDVNGSFYASTAHSLRFSDGTRFESRLGSDVTLSFAAPSGFGFGDAAIAPLAVLGATLRTAPGSTVGLVGGEILVGGARGNSRLQALGGEAILVAVGSPGVVGFGENGISLSGFGALGNVSLQSNSFVNASEGTDRRGGGAIHIRGHHIALDHATVVAETVFGNARGISIEGAGDVTVRDSKVSTLTTGSGDAGAIRLSGRNVVVLASTSPTIVDTSCDPGCTNAASGGRLEVRATDAFIIRSVDPSLTAYVVSNSFGGGPTGEIHVEAGTLVIDGNAYLQGISEAQGDATLIQLRTGNILMLNGGQVDASARASGRGGAIVVENSSGIRLEGLRVEESTGVVLPSGFFANARGSGNAGSITVSTRTLDVVSGGEISSSAQFRSTGAGGNIHVNAGERILVSGTDARGSESAIVTNTLGTGAAGEIVLAAPTIEITNRGRVQSLSEGPGAAGRIRIDGRDLRLATQGQISTDAPSTGRGGEVEVHLTGTLSISDDFSGIFAKTYGPARGGNIVIDAPRIVLSNGGGVFTTTVSSGDAGTIRVHAAESIIMDTQSRIESEATSSGAAGRLDIRTDGRLVMSNGSRISTSTTRSGNAGEVVVHAGEGLFVTRNASIASESLSTGLAGNVHVTSDGLLELRDGGRITTAARSSDGGNITVDANVALLESGRITTEVGSGQGGGGNMEIRVPTLVLRDSVITANAFGGPGGNIHIATKTFIPSVTSRVTASSQLGVDGTITLESPALDPTGQLLVPPVAFFDAGSVLAGRCGPRLAGRASSLVVEPRRLPDVSPDALRSMLEILGQASESSCPAPAARF